MFCWVYKKFFKALFFSFILIILNFSLVVAAPISEVPGTWNTNYDKSVSLKYSKSEIEISGLTYDLKIPKYSSTIKSPCSGRIYQSTRTTTSIACRGTFTYQGMDVGITIDLNFNKSSEVGWVLEYSKIFDSGTRDWLDSTTTPTQISGTNGVYNQYSQLIIDSGNIKVKFSDVTLFVDLDNKYSVSTNNGDTVLRLFPEMESSFYFGLDKYSSNSGVRTLVPLPEYNLKLDYFKNGNNSNYDLSTSSLFQKSSLGNYYELDLIGHWLTTDSIRISAVKSGDLRPLSESFFGVTVAEFEQFPILDFSNSDLGYELKLNDYFGISPEIYNTTDYRYGGSLGKKIDCNSLDVKNMEDFPDGTKILRACFDSNIFYTSSTGNTVISYTTKSSNGKWCFEGINIKRISLLNGEPITLNLNTEIPFEKSCENGVYYLYSEPFVGRETPHNNNVYIDSVTNKNYNISIEGFYLKPYAALSKNDLNNDNLFNIGDILELLKRLLK